MGIIRRPSISPPPPFPSPYESGWSRRSRREQKYNWKKFSRENFPLLSNKTKTLFLGGGRGGEGTSVFFLLRQTCGPREMVSNLEIRGAEVEIIRDYFFGGGEGEGIAILFERLRWLFNPCAICRILFAWRKREGNAGVSRPGTRISQWARRVYTYTLCVIVKGDARKWMGLERLDQLGGRIAKV